MKFTIGRNLSAVDRNWAMIAGNVMSEIAKMIGIIPAWLRRIGMLPCTPRPAPWFAYVMGMSRCASVKSTTATSIANETMQKR